MLTLQQLARAKQLEAAMAKPEKALPLVMPPHSARTGPHTQTPCIATALSTQKTPHFCVTSRSPCGAAVGGTPEDALPQAPRSVKAGSRRRTSDRQTLSVVA